MVKTYFSHLIALLLLCTAFGLISQPARAETSAAPAALPFLHAQGDQLAGPYNRSVVLKGCNLGNWLMIEPWMLGGCIEATDQAQIFSTFRQRFGDTRAEHLIHLYRDRYITDRDVELIKSFGFNVVRVPFDYRILQEDEAPYAIKADAFFWLDKTLDMAQRAGVYVILDLHGAPGGQSNQMHTGQAEQNHLWDNATDQNRTVALWQAIAARYQNRSVVAAYDLLNEPYGNYHQDLRGDLTKLVARLYTAIRGVDSKHIIFAPGALNGGVEFYGNPHDKGWSDVGFTEHYYAGLFGDTPALESHARVLERQFPSKLATMQQWGVPYYVGEFNVVLSAAGGPRVMRAYYDWFAKTGWPATMWSYKLIKTEGGTGPDAWYMVTNADPLPTLDLQASSYEDFEKFFASMDTMKLAINEPLRQILTEPNPSPLALKSYSKLPTTAPVTAAKVFESGPLHGYQATDIGGAMKGAVAVEADNSIRVWASGSDIFSTADSFRFISKAMYGNNDLTARLLTLQDSDQWAKAGLMARWGESAGAAFAFVHAFPDGTVALLGRSRPGGTTTEIKCFAVLPVDLKISVTDGKAVGSYRAPAGTWHRLGSVNVSNNPDYRLGLAATSHAPEVYTTAVFRLGGLPAFAPSIITAKNQLLLNGSFESQTGWNHWGDSMNRQTNPAFARTGAADIACGPSSLPSGLWQDVHAIPGRRYTLSVWANRDKLLSSGSGSIELRLESTDADHQVTLNAVTFTTDDLPADGQWLRLRVSATAINSSMRTLIIYTSAQTGVIHLDDAALAADGSGRH